MEQFAPTPFNNIGIQIPEMIKSQGFFCCGENNDGRRCFVKNHETYMKLALELAQKGAGQTNPNPMVGAVIVRGGAIIGLGWHKAFGKDHAEVAAIKDARLQGHELQGSTLYVNLEPCCHTGKTPPCTEAIIESGIQKVFVAQEDPNPQVAGKGIKRLRQQGITVTVGLLSEKAEWLNRVFNHFIVTKQPYVRLKTAMSLDGKIATQTGESQWITSTEAREAGRKMRGESMALLTGRGTLEADDPLLTCRTVGLKEPIRILLDRQLQASPDYKLFSPFSLSQGSVWVVCEKGANLAKREAYREKGVRVLELPSPLNLKELVQTLGEEGIDSLHIEAGSTLSGLAIAEGIVQELCTFIAPKLIGGKEAKGLLAEEGVSEIEAATELCMKETKPIGSDLFIRSLVLKKQGKID